MLHKLQFIEELLEARMYRNEDILAGKSVNDIAKLAYLMMLMLEILRYEDNRYAMRYANDTMSYDNFERMRGSTTDLHNLLSVINSQDYYDRVKPDPQISLPLLQTKRYFRDVVSNHKDRQQDRSYFMKLESYFKISDGWIKNARRNVCFWYDLSATEKSTTRKEIKNYLMGVSQQNDIFVHFKSVHYKQEI